MEKKIVFGVDVDGVLRDNLGTMVELYNNRFGETMTIDNVKWFAVGKSFPKFGENGIDGRDFFFNEHADEIFLDAKPCHGAVKAMEILSQHGTVVIVTNQFGIGNKTRTLEWLKRNKIQYDSIFFTPHKHLLNCDVMIDDNTDFFNGSLARKAVVIEAPYNVSVPDEGIIDSSYNILTVERYKTLHDYALVFKN